MDTTRSAKSRGGIFECRAGPGFALASGTAQIPTALHGHAVDVDRVRKRSLDLYLAQGYRLAIVDEGPVRDRAGCDLPAQIAPGHAIAWAGQVVIGKGGDDTAREQCRDDAFGGETV